MLKYFAVAVGFLLGGCASLDQHGADEEGVLRSKLTRAQVKEIAAARARENGINVDTSAPWELSLKGERGGVWTAMLQIPGKSPPGYWLLVEDATGKADFVLPTIGMQTAGRPLAADWLPSVEKALGELQFPVPAEELLRRIGVPGFEFDSGGTLKGGQMYLEGTLHREASSIARFELRCYIATPKRWTDPKIVTGVEIAYVDEQLNRYLLRRAEQ